MPFARSRVQSAGSLAAVAAASSAAAPAAAAFLGWANIAARQFIVYESAASHAARPREQSHLLGTRATLDVSTAVTFLCSFVTTWQQFPSNLVNRCFNAYLWECGTLEIRLLDGHRWILVVGLQQRRQHVNGFQETVMWSTQWPYWGWEVILCWLWLLENSENILGSCLKIYLVFMLVILKMESDCWLGMGRIGSFANTLKSNLKLHLTCAQIVLQKWCRPGSLWDGK